MGVLMFSIGWYWVDQKDLLASFITFTWHLVAWAVCCPTPLCFMLLLHCCRWYCFGFSGRANIRKFVVGVWESYCGLYCRMVSKRLPTPPFQFLPHQASCWMWHKFLRRRQIENKTSNMNISTGQPPGLHWPIIYLFNTRQGKFNDMLIVWLCFNSFFIFMLGIQGYTNCCIKWVLK